MDGNKKTGRQRLIKNINRRNSKVLDGFGDAVIGGAHAALGAAATAMGVGTANPLIGGGGLALIAAGAGQAASGAVTMKKNMRRSIKLNRAAKATERRDAVGRISAKLKSKRKASAKKSTGNGTVKTHARRTKSGKTATVKQHSRTPTRNPKR